MTMEGSRPQSVAQTPAGRLRWRFGPVQLDEASLQLTVNGTVREVEPKPLDLLMLLLRRAGEVVTKDQLLETLWPGRIVTEASLTKCVAKLRAALDDEAQTLVRTVHGYGYKLGVPVQAESLEEAPPAAPAPMPAAVSRRSADRRLVAIMFTDMVGYTRLVQQDESVARELLERMRRVVRTLLPEFGGREIEVIGDAFLVEFASALRAMECAIALQQQLGSGAPPSRQRICLRIGLHVGDIERLGEGVFGDSVNIASRIQSVAPEGGIALSGPVHDQIANKLPVSFESRGPTALKGIERPVDLHVLDPAAIAALPPMSAGVPAGTFRRPRVLAMAGAGALALVLGATWLALREERPVLSAGASPSVAVLPFANFSGDPQNGYFADGIHDAILAHLARIPGLKVTSRTSVAAYRDAKDASARDIARALGVAHIVEGSVQRSGGRVRITAQLIEADSDRHLWADTYDRDLADVFTIQSDVAQRISTSVHATLTPSARRAIERHPTADPRAYDLYLRAMDIERNRSVDTADFYFRMQSLLEQVVTLDPSFDLAHAALAAVHISMYWWAFDLTPERREKARRAAETALRLNPNSPEAHLAQGKYFYYGHRDYDRALGEFQQALKHQPGNADIHAFLGYVSRRQARWDKALGHLRDARELDPKNPTIVRGEAETLELMHRFAEADALYQQWLAEHPEDVVMQIYRVRLARMWKGDLDFIDQTLRAIPPSIDPESRVTLERAELAAERGELAEAVRLLTDCNCAWIGLPGGSRYPKDVLLADLHDAKGDKQAARQAWSRARGALEPELAQRPDDAVTRVYLAVALAGLGEKGAALEASRRALASMPASRDAMVTTDVHELHARVLMMTGDVDGALGELEVLARNPGAYTVYSWSKNPVWRSLHQHPRFLRLAGTKAAT
jgi:TolB-like protein/class 3 adenylate cyclase/tetratricopeptide (TPR) repeat protein